MRLGFLVGEVACELTLTDLKTAWIEKKTNSIETFSFTKIFLHLFSRNEFRVCLKSDKLDDVEMRKFNKNKVIVISWGPTTDVTLKQRKGNNGLGTASVVYLVVYHPFVWMVTCIQYAAWMLLLIVKFIRSVSKCATLMQNNRNSGVYRKILFSLPIPGQRLINAVRNE